MSVPTLGSHTKLLGQENPDNTQGTVDNNRSESMVTTKDTKYKVNKDNKDKGCLSHKNKFALYILRSITQYKIQQLTVGANNTGPRLEHCTSLLKYHAITISGTNFIIMSVGYMVVMYSCFRLANNILLSTNN